MTHAAQDTEEDRRLREMNAALLASSIRQQELTEKAQQAEARLEVMVAELQHRTRNLIAVVSSIAQQTMEQTGPTEAFREEFSHRLEALSRVQGLLSRSDEEPVTIEALIGMELDALGLQDSERGNVVLDGPVVQVRNSMVQTLALAIHELATNARKHGGLSREEGRLDVKWRVRETNGRGRRLALEWKETGASAAIELPQGRRGYGRELIERALPFALGAKTTYDLRPEGAHCTIDLPLERERSSRRGL